METDRANRDKGENRKTYPIKGPIKFLYIALGVIALALGAIGTILPFVPTTPFILFAAVCFGKSSERLHVWFVSTQFYRKNLESFVQRRGMTIKAKITLIAAITFFMGFSFFMMFILSAPVFAKIVLMIVWLCHVLYFGFKVKTIR